MAANPFTWVEIYVQDLERAKTFYEAVFDFKLAARSTPPRNRLANLASSPC
jgi:predicted enzyme related to lactoylglutathione lyase